MDHYFTGGRAYDGREYEIPYAYGGKQYRFISGAGVFSAKGIDAASDLLLRQMPPLSGSILDLGCGYGLIGVVLAKEHNLELTQVDVNPNAVSLAKRNCEINGVNAITVVSDGFEHITGSFDTIAVNPPIHAGKQTVFDLYAGALLHLNAGGALYVVIRKKHGAPSSAAYLENAFGNCDVLYRRKGYNILRCLMKEN